MGKADKKIEEHMQEDRSCRLTKLLFTLLVVLNVPVSRACGASNESSFSLEKISVTADSLEAGKRTVSLEKVRRSQSRDIKDVFAAEPSVTVGGGARSAQRIYLRGVEGTNLNITIDGATQGRNLFQHRGNAGGIDPDLLKSVVVAPGPVADNGAGALGGSIAFETVDAQDLLYPGRSSGFMLKNGYATVDDSWRGSAAAYGLVGGWLGVLAHVSAENSGDYRAGGGEDVHGSAGKDRDYFLKLSVLDKAGHSVRVSAEKNTNSGLYRWGAGDAGYDESATLYYQESERETYVFDHRYRMPDSRLVDWRFNLYKNNLYLKNRDSGTETESEGTGGQVRNTALFDLAGTSHRLTVGADYYFEEGTHRNQGVQTGTDNKAENLGFFVRHRMSIGPLGISFGARYDDYETAFGGMTVSGGEWSPSAGVELELSRGLTAHAGYGEAVRSTGIIPVQWLANASATPTFNTQTGKNSYGKPFEPERSLQREIGLRYSGSGLVAFGDNFSITGTLFKTKINNLIMQIGGTQGRPVSGFYNDDPLISSGWEVRGSWSSGSFSSTLGYSHVDTEDQYGNPLAITRRKGASTGDRMIWDTRWRASGNLIFGYTLTALGAIKKGALDRPGYVLHDLQAEWLPEGLDGVSFSMVVNNLLDRRYCDQTSIESGDTVIYEPGRDLRLVASYRF